MADFIKMRIITLTLSRGNLSCGTSSAELQSRNGALLFAFDQSKYARWIIATWALFSIVISELPRRITAAFRLIVPTIVGDQFRIYPEIVMPGSKSNGLMSLTGTGFFFTHCHSINRVSVASTDLDLVLWCWGFTALNLAAQQAGKGPYVWY